MGKALKKLLKRKKAYVYELKKLEVEEMEKEKRTNRGA